MDKYKRTYGFSLLELIIVVVIIGVLAAVAVPIYHKNIENAKRTEAVAGIGEIRQQLFISYGVNGSYPVAETFTRVIGADWNDIKPGELDGTYFSDADYRYRSYDGIAYRIKCKKAGVLEKNVWLDEAGHWKYDVLDED
jgi:prepilin-type N-terminal cleavage/methylation domain-containing protein